MKTIIIILVALTLLIAIGVVIVMNLSELDGSNFSTKATTEVAYKKQNITLKTKDYSVKGYVGNSNYEQFNRNYDISIMSSNKRNNRRNYHSNTLLSVNGISSDIDASSINSQVIQKHSYQRTIQSDVLVEQVRFNTNTNSLKTPNMIAQNIFNGMSVYKAPPTGGDFGGMDDPGVPLDNELLVLSFLGLFLGFVKRSKQSV